MEVAARVAGLVTHAVQRFKRAALQFVVQNDASDRAAVVCNLDLDIARHVIQRGVMPELRWLPPPAVVPLPLIALGIAMLLEQLLTIGGERDNVGGLRGME